MPDTDFDFHDFEEKFLKSIEMPSEVELLHRIPQFRHIFSYGMGSVYFSYLISDIYSADAWDAFVTEGRGPWDTSVAERLSSYVLSKGNSVDPENAYNCFRGKPVSIDAYLRKMGFVETTPPPINLKGKCKIPPEKNKRKKPWSCGQ
jgi:peptidyl-dipeptidase Dcp